MTTRRRRRLVVALASGALAVIGLGACRSEPGVAAYLGDHKITEATVDSTIEKLRGEAEKAGGQVTPPSRNQVVTILVLNEVCDRIAADQQLPLPRTDPATATYADKVRTVDACFSALKEQGGSATPTQEDLRDVFRRAEQAQALPPGATFEEFGPQIEAVDEVRQALGARKSLADAIGQYDLTMSPRYRPIGLSLWSLPDGSPGVILTLSPADPTPMVVDLPQAPVEQAPPAA